MNIKDLVHGKDYKWTIHTGSAEVLTFDKLVESIFGISAQFTNGVILTERTVNVDVSEIEVTPPTPVPHIHAKELIAFANGYEIEVYTEYAKWVKIFNPIWHVRNKYRVKTDNTRQIALLEKVVADLNEEIETRQVKKQGWLKRLQELQS